MTKRQPTASEQHKRLPKLPPLKHLVHHTEPDGTIHALCGHIWTPGTSKKVSASNPLTLCPACVAAHHLLDILP